MVKRLRLGEGDQIDDAIQRKLDDVFRRSNLEGDTEGIHSSVDSSHSLFVTRTRVTLDSALREDIKRGYQTDTRWDNIMT